MNKLTTLSKLLIVFAILAVLASIKLFWYDQREVDAKTNFDAGKITLPDNPEASLLLSDTAILLNSTSEGAIIKDNIDLASMGLSWRNDLYLNPKFLEIVNYIKTNL